MAIDKQYSFTYSDLRGLKQSFISDLLYFQFFRIYLLRLSRIFVKILKISNYCKGFILWKLIYLLFWIKFSICFLWFQEITLQLFDLIFSQYFLYKVEFSSILAQRTYLVCSLIRFASVVLNIFIMRFNCIILSTQNTILRQDGQKENTPALYSPISSIIHSISTEMLYLDVEDSPIGLRDLDCLKNYISYFEVCNSLGSAYFLMKIDLNLQIPQGLYDKNCCNQFIITLLY